MKLHQALGFHPSREATLLDRDAGVLIAGEGISPPYRGTRRMTGWRVA
jgi:hypothetical protein